MEQEHREQRPLLRSPEREQPTVVEHLERSQDPELHDPGHANTGVTAALQPGVTLFRNEADERPQVKRGEKMLVSTSTLRRLVTLAAALGAVMVAAPLAQAETDGSLLTQASQDWALQHSTINPGQVTDSTLLTEAAGDLVLQLGSERGTDGALLSDAAEAAALKELARINPGRVSDGMLLTEESHLYELAQIDPGYGTGESRSPTGSTGATPRPASASQPERPSSRRRRSRSAGARHRLTPTETPEHRGRAGS
jgi:hypothetical protein